MPLSPYEQWQHTHTQEITMPSPRFEKSCACGCGEMTSGGKFRPGHDSKLLSAILQHIDGDIAHLRSFVELHTGETVVVSH